jgi:hypothetical protein
VGRWADDDDARAGDGDGDGAAPTQPMLGPGHCWASPLRASSAARLVCAACVVGGGRWCGSGAPAARGPGELIHPHPALPCPTGKQQPAVSAPRAPPLPEVPEHELQEARLLLEEEVMLVRWGPAAAACSPPAAAAARLCWAPVCRQPGVYATCSPRQPLEVPAARAGTARPHPPVPAHLQVRHGPHRQRGGGVPGRVAGGAQGRPLGALAAALRPRSLRHQQRPPRIHQQG